MYLPGCPKDGEDAEAAGFALPPLGGNVRMGARFRGNHLSSTTCLTHVFFKRD